MNNLNSIYIEIKNYSKEEEQYGKQYGTTLSYGEQYGTTLRILFQEWKEEFKKGQAFMTNKEGDFALKKILPEWVTSSDMMIMFENLKLKRAEILQNIEDLKPTQNVETFFQLFLSSNTEPPCWLTVKNMLSLEDIYQKQGKRDGSSHNRIREMKFDEASWYADRNENDKNKGERKEEREQEGERKEEYEQENREYNDHCPADT